MPPLDLRTFEERHAFDTSKHYLGTLCLRNHDAGGGKSWRNIGHGNCVLCTRERARSWKAENPDRAAASCRRRDVSRNKRDRRKIWPFAIHVSGAMCRSKAAGWSYDLTADSLKLLWRKQEGLCFWTGRPLDFYVGGPAHPFRPALDRLYPDKGYVNGNVVWSSNFANRARGDLDPKEFAEIMSSFGVGIDFTARFAA